MKYCVFDMKFFFLCPKDIFSKLMLKNSFKNADHSRLGRPESQADNYGHFEFDSDPNHGPRSPNVNIHH